MKTHLWPKKGRSRKWLILGPKPWNPDTSLVPYLEAASAKQTIRAEPALGSGCGRSPAGQTSPRSQGSSIRFINLVNSRVSERV